MNNPEDFIAETCPEALLQDVCKTLRAEVESLRDRVTVKNLALMAAASILERIEIADGGTYGDLKETVESIAQALRA